MVRQQADSADSAALAVRPLVSSETQGLGPGGCSAHFGGEPKAALARPQSQHVVLPSACASVAHLAPFDFAGPAETLWDGGMFQVELVFPPDFPDAPPYVHFLTPMFHPHISPLGVPYLRSLIMWNNLEPREKSVSSLLTVLASMVKRAVPAAAELATHGSMRPHACSRRPSAFESRAWAAWAPQRSPGASPSRRLRR